MSSSRSHHISDEVRRKAAELPERSIVFGGRRRTSLRRGTVAALNSTHSYDVVKLFTCYESTSGTMGPHLPAVQSHATAETENASSESASPTIDPTRPRPDRTRSRHLHNAYRCMHPAAAVVSSTAPRCMCAPGPPSNVSDQTPGLNTCRGRRFDCVVRPPWRHTCMQICTPHRKSPLPTFICSPRRAQPRARNTAVATHALRSTTA